MFKWFWTIFSLGAPVSLKQDLKADVLREMENAKHVKLVQFFVSVVLGPGGGVLAEKLGRDVRPASQNPYLFMTKICDFPYPIYDLTKNLIPYLWPDP